MPPAGAALTIASLPDALLGHVMALACDGR
jgi:hypothetical protein